MKLLTQFLSFLLNFNAAMKNRSLNMETQKTELAKHKPQFVGVQKVRWDKVGIVVL
jgi:hypothetical protein